MDTAAIVYRVAEFLKAHPPFSAMDERDLLDFSSRGRVRFHEAHDYILWQGEPNRFKVFVIQQGTVELWDEQAERADLRDVRGVGDLLGVETLAGAHVYAHSARTSTDCLLYVFSSFDFDALVLRYPSARQFVDAYDAVTADYHVLDARARPDALFLQDVIRDQPLTTCDERATLADVARLIQRSGAEAVGVLQADRTLLGVVTSDRLLAWLAEGAGDSRQSVAPLARAVGFRTAPPQVTVADVVLGLGTADDGALVVTSDGTATGSVQAIVTGHDLAPVFGDQPTAILHAIRRAGSLPPLRALNHRVRALALQYLTSGTALDWIARFIHLADVAILRRVIAVVGGDSAAGCWCLTDAAGRGESLTRQAPGLVLIGDDTASTDNRAILARVIEACHACDYLPRTDQPFDTAFYAADVREWRGRYEAWLADPIMSAFYPARGLADLRPLETGHPLWGELAATVHRSTSDRFLQVLANDCLDSLPPLTFFQDAVLDDSGKEADVFHLQRSALGPLVDVGRVFGFATGHVLGTSTLDRFAAARRRLPEHEAVLREAADTFRIVLLLQSRVGIGQGTAGTELPPSLLSRHDRHVLKAGFRSILRLLEFTADSTWLRAL